VDEIWMIEYADDFQKSFKRLRKQHPMSADRALIKAHHYLNVWLNNPQLGRGFNNPGWIHREGRGVMALDQGTQSNLAPVRIYFWLDERGCKMWLIWAGDKKSQYADIAYCHYWLKLFNHLDDQDA
jgi:hypothetical protein